MRKITHEEFTTMFNDKYSDKFELLSEFTGMKNKITIKCKKCTHIHQAIPEHVMKRKRKCPNCRKYEQYSEYDRLTKDVNTNFKLLNIQNQKRLIEHLKCGSIFLIDRIKWKNRCPVCEEESKYNVIYSTLLKKFGQNKFKIDKELILDNGRKMKVDFYIEALDIYIDLYGDYLLYPTGRPSIFIEYEEELNSKQIYCEKNKIKYCILQQHNDILDILFDLHSYFKRRKCTYNHFTRWRRTKKIKKLKKRNR